MGTVIVELVVDVLNEVVGVAFVVDLVVTVLAELIVEVLNEVVGVAFVVVGFVEDELVVITVVDVVESSVVG